MSLQTRVVNILTNPTSEWPVIAGESDDIATIYRSYAVPLAAIPAVCTFLGLLVFGLPFLGRPGLMGALSTALGNYVGTLVGLIVAAVVIQKLAPNFGSSGSTGQALKLVAYTSTPIWVAGVLNLVPALAALSLVAALYAIYLAYLGLPPVMKTPQDKVVVFLVVAAVVMLVVGIVLSMLLSVFGLGPSLF
jgi:hypothetical protein